MKRAVLVFFFVVAAAHADPPTPPSTPTTTTPAPTAPTTKATKPTKPTKEEPLHLTLVHESGESSRDFSRSTVTVTLDGNQVRYRSTYSGRDRGFPGNNDVDKKGTVKDVAAVRAVLDELAKTPTTSTMPESNHESVYSTWCLTVPPANARCLGHNSNTRVNGVDDGADEQLMGKLLHVLTTDLPPGL